MLLPTPPFALVTATLRTSTPLPRRAAPAAPGPKPRGHHILSAGLGPSLSRSLASKVPRSPIALVSRQLGTKVPRSPGNSVPIDPRPMIPRPIGFPVPCSLGIQVPIHPGSMLPRSLQRIGNMAPGDLGTMPHQDTKAPRSMATLRPWSIAGWVARDQGRPVAPMPWSLDGPCALATGCRGSSRHRRSSLSMDLGANGPGHQAIKVAAIPRRRGWQAAAGNSAPSSHRPPWSLALMGPSSTRHFTSSTTLVPCPNRSLVASVPRSRSHQVDAGGMVPSPPACRGARCTSVAGRPWRQAVCSPLGCQGAILI